MLESWFFKHCVIYTGTSIAFFLAIFHLLLLQRLVDSVVSFVANMGMVTIHLVVGVGVFLLPLFLLLFILVVMEIAHLYIVIGAVSFVSSVLTTVVLVTKFVNQPAAHGFFAYSDTIARWVKKPKSWLISDIDHWKTWLTALWCPWDYYWMES